MPDSPTCPTRTCGRDKPAGDMLCRRCWYVLSDELKRPYIRARAALEASRTRQNMQALLAAKRKILESINPGRGV